VSHIRYVAQRYLFGRHRVRYIVFISRIAMLGMALGVTTLMLALAVLRGFQQVVTAKIVGFDSHIRIERLFDGGNGLDKEIQAAIQEIDGVESFFPIRKSEIMLEANDRTEGVFLESMPASALARLTSVTGNLTNPAAALDEGLIMGGVLAERLKVEEGDFVLIYELGSDLDQGSYPSVVQIPVDGIYNSGMSDYDKLYTYAASSKMEMIMGDGGETTEYGIFINDLNRTRSVMHAIDELLPYSFMTISWQERHQTLFRWMRTQQLPILIIFGLIMLVAVVNIASTLVLIILERRQEIGTLRALGTSRRGIMSIFAAQGLILGLIGSASGILLGLALGWIQHRFGIIRLPSDVYFMDQVAILFRFWDTFFIALVVILLGTLASLIPAWQAGRLAPADSLRCE